MADVVKTLCNYSSSIFSLKQILSALVIIEKHAKWDSVDEQMGNYSFSKSYFFKYKIEALELPRLDELVTNTKMWFLNRIKNDHELYPSSIRYEVQRGMLREWEW